MTIDSQNNSQTIRKTLVNITSAIAAIKMLIDLHPNPRKRDRMKATIRKKLLETIEKYLS